MALSRAGKSNSNYKGHMHRLCKQCCEELGVGASKTTAFCSRECYAANQRTSNYAKICEWCGKDFSHRNNKHCSVACATAHRTSKLTDSGKAKRVLKARKAAGEPIRAGQPKKPRTIRVCQVCGKGMLLSPSAIEKGTKFCSRRCYGKHVSTRQSGELHHNYKDGKSKERVSERQSARKHPLYREWRQSVFNRDSHTCQSCRQVGGELRAHHIASWVDDIKMRLKVSNGITMCSECHRMWHLYDKKGLFTGKESLLQSKIRDALIDYGFYVYNVPGTPMGVNGTPDLLVCFNGLFGGVEVKVHPNYLTPLQSYAGERIKEAGGIFYVAKSIDDIGRLIEMFELRQLSGSWVSAEKTDNPTSPGEMESWLNEQSTDRN